jgi:large subunit ribosomal protein L29
MKSQEAREMTDDELRTRERELTEELFHLRLRRATSQLPNPMKVRETKRDLARVRTILRQRLAGEAGAGTPSGRTRSGARGRRRTEVGPERAQRGSTGRAPGGDR